MARIKIYLRAIHVDDAIKLSLFDSHREGNINDLVTVAKRGDVIIWKRDFKSGIKGIKGIFPDGKEQKIFASLPRKHKICKKWKYKVPKDAIGEEKYNIKFELDNKEIKTIDPAIRIDYP